MVPHSRLGALLIVIFAICILDLVFVWHAVEHELESIQLTPPISSNDAQEMQKKLQPHHPANITIDPQKHYAYKILQNAGVNPITPEIISQLPHWSDVVSQYGSKPIIRNLESCPRYRETVPQKDRFTGPAGLFNTGTNLLANLMIHNCQIGNSQGGTGMRQTIAWGKHNPPKTHRLKNVAQKGGKGVNQTASFPLVIIKDPYHWHGSQCRHKYSTNWEHDQDHCPNIISWKSGEPVKVSVKYALGRVEYPTMIEQWNSWYNEYEQEQSSYPLAILRFEDILFHAEEVVAQLCDCVGGSRRGDKLKYPEDSAKDYAGHEGSNGLLNALIRYGNPDKRLEGWTKKDWVYSRSHLDWDLMDKYGYNRPDGSNELL